MEHQDLVVPAQEQMMVQGILLDDLAKLGLL
jgi:hypothetical protein